MGFISGDWEGQSNFNFVLILFSLMKSLMTNAVCLGSLSSLNTNLLPSSNFLTDSWRFRRKISKYTVLVIMMIFKQEFNIFGRISHYLTSRLFDQVWTIELENTLQEREMLWNINFICFKHKMYLSTNVYKYIYWEFLFTLFFVRNCILFFAVAIAICKNNVLFVSLLCYLKD